MRHFRTGRFRMFAHRASSTRVDRFLKQARRVVTDDTTATKSESEIGFERRDMIQKLQHSDTIDTETPDNTSRPPFRFPVAVLRPRFIVALAAMILVLVGVFTFPTLVDSNALVVLQRSPFAPVDDIIQLTSSAFLTDSTYEFDFVIAQLY